ncbi:DAK2 domain-containing protein [Saccharibacillus sp. CPCC 101409]|uniref:DAK2 domain-containing protein n=1 Tax=Saccharibacillus sp. CPCC 101409 TaxID=3058041 RepID=UPI00267267F1|nr:DAK2 domain-containing protein [Saccharibacillus sp. CPCC 101409]MDO3409386.1 DAK2 domain-containing protein [Saccharibacillus sp. CPCC 101409]
MSRRSINGNDFTGMVLAGAERLSRQAEHVNALNVFPVPDGDTGTNMNLTMTAGVAELRERSSASIGQSATVLSKGLLMGARGNSGVILSQLFRGFGRYASTHTELNAIQFAAALQVGVDTAYKAVVKPVEGTILTVAREAAKHAASQSRRTTDVVELMREVLDKAQAALDRTPEQLPVLKQVGVVDSGGQGLVYIYEGFLAHLENGSAEGAQASAPAAGTSQPRPVSAQTAPPAVTQVPLSAQAQLDTENIEFLYDMEFFINLSLGEGSRERFDEEALRRALAVNGDSIIIIADDDIVKVHVHSKTPGEVMTIALRYGEITQIHILNMREQHRDLLHAGMDGAPSPELFADIPSPPAAVEETAALPADEVAPYGFIAVASGAGIEEIFKSLGVDIVLSGGQTMNPSTEDFVNAIGQLSAQHVFLLPNNSNIVLAAQQARDLLEGERQITVVPCNSIPQGIAAALAFQEEENSEVNESQMLDALKQVKTGQITHAVRDTTFDGLEIKAGDYIGIYNSKIVATAADRLTTSRTLLSAMIESGDEVVTLLAGEEAVEDETAELADWLSSEYPDAEIEFHSGGQPVYDYLFSVEA